MIHENSECRATGPARATITGQPLAETELRGIDCFWRACNYLAAGMIYLRDNPLLARPLVVADIKKRLLGHWGSSPGLSFLYIHANRLIRNNPRRRVKNLWSQSEGGEKVRLLAMPDDRKEAEFVVDEIQRR